MKEVKVGSIWSGSDHNNVFRVIHVVEAEGHTWVHYRNEAKGLIETPVREYSCYIESFLQRFTQLPE